MIWVKCYYNLDVFVWFIVLFVKYLGEVINIVIKINLLNKVFGIVVGVFF